MANNFDSNFTLKLAKGFLAAFETERVLSKNVNTQKLDGKFNPASGTTTAFKRPTDYKSKRTATGDISGGTRSDIITGQALGIVQDYFTVDVDYNEDDQSLKMDELVGLLRPAARRLVTDLELDFGKFMLSNTALLSGTVGSPVADWADVANAGATMSAHGVPRDKMWCYGMNSFTDAALAGETRGIGAGGAMGSTIQSAHEKAMVRQGFAGMDMYSTESLASYSTFSDADRAGTLSADVDATYLAAKDTMTQTLQVAGFGANTVVAAGETVEIAGSNRLNLSTRQPVVDAAGNQITWTATVVEAVTLSGTGTGTITVTGPAIQEAEGAYNTVDVAPLSGAVVTLLGAESSLIQPNMMWHPDAFSIGSVPIAKLYSTDTVATTEDGLQIRVSKYSDGDANKQVVRYDLRPAYAVLNPFFAGKSFG